MVNFPILYLESMTVNKRCQNYCRISYGAHEAFRGIEKQPCWCQSDVIRGNFYFYVLALEFVKKSPFEVKWKIGFIMENIRVSCFRVLRHTRD